MQRRGVPTEGGLVHRWGLAAVVLLCCATLAVGWWTKARCLDDGGWADGEEYTSWCYTDVLPLWFVERLDDGAVPYLDHPVEYPVITGVQMGLTAAVVHALPGEPAGTTFFHLTALTGAALLLGVLWLLIRQGVPPHRLVWFAGAPTLAVYAFINWDPLAVLLLVAGIAAHRRGRDGWAGVALGLGAAAKLFPVFAVPVIMLARWAQGRRRDALVHGAWAAGAWLAVNVPVYLAAPEGWLRFLELNRERPADWDSLWYLAQRLFGASIETPAVNRWSLALFVAGAAAILALGTSRRDPERWWELTLPVLVWFLLTNKVYSPQFSLWLLPLLALALPRVAPFAAFAVADLMVFALRFPFLGGERGLMPAPGYDLFAWIILVRAAILVWILVESVWLPLERRAGESAAVPLTTATGSHGHPVAGDALRGT